MTNEQEVLAYLYTIPAIQRKQLVIALPDMPYQSLTLAVRNAVSHGYVERYLHDGSYWLRLTQPGARYIRSVARGELDMAKHMAAKRHTEHEKTRRIQRIELTANLCYAAGVSSAAVADVSLSDICGAPSPRQKKFFESLYLDKGVLFTPDDIARTLQSNRSLGEESYAFRSRVTGLVINHNGIFVLYNTLDRLMRWEPHSEALLVRNLATILSQGSAAEQYPNFADSVRRPFQAVILGKSCALLPKIITGNKWGRADKARSLSPQLDMRDKLLTLENLRRIYARSFFVPTSTLGVELLSRTLFLSKAELLGMEHTWLDGQGNYTVVTSGGYTEGYKSGDEKQKTTVFPVLQFEELVYHKSGTDAYHVVCERSTQEGVARSLGQKVLSISDFDGALLPVHKYDDDGVRMDGVNPLTKQGYVAQQ